MRLVLAVVVGAVMLCGSSMAAAAQRYATPAGTGTTCSQGTPCPLQEAIEKAAANDEVIVGGGTYPVAAPIFPEAAGVFIHGDLSAPMPRIVGMTGGVPIGTGNATRLSYLDISNSGAFRTAAICNPGSLIERIRAISIGEGAVGLTINGNCTVRDSLALAEGLASMAVFAYGYPGNETGSARNLTAIAIGPQSTGIAARYTPELMPGEYTLDLRNTIASGERADLATLASTGGPASIDVSNSNFDSVDNEAGGTVDGAANQTAPPLFVDPAGGDYREAAGSPTIDAGSADGAGELDPEGNARALGAAPDIGAYEFVPPPAPVAQVESLLLSPHRFRAAKAGSAVISRGRGAPLGSNVKLALSAAATVSFSVERGRAGRLVGKRCRKPTRGNRKRKRCTLWRPRRGGFERSGPAGADSFRFSGRLNGRSLRPGRYRLVAAVGDSLRRAGFRIVR